MRPAERSRTMLVPAFVALVAVGCCAGLPLIAGALAGVTLVAILGVGSGAITLFAVVVGIVVLLRTRRGRVPGGPSR